MLTASSCGQAACTSSGQRTLSAAPLSKDGGYVGTIKDGRFYMCTLRVAQDRQVLLFPAAPGEGP